ncbi:MAG: hypothetical protein ACFB0E_19190, partial [Leptolyngbyaceae cyanobacterium]
LAATPRDDAGAPGSGALHRSDYGGDDAHLELPIADDIFLCSELTKSCVIFSFRNQNLETLLPFSPGF